MTEQLRDHPAHANGTAVAHPVTCEEFQSRLPELLGDENIRNHEHLKTCARCHELLEELEYIASIASDLLLPVHEPGPAVWTKIKDLLPEEEEAAKAAPPAAE